MHWIALDFETTGLSPIADHRIVEIGAVRLDESGQVVATFETLVAPERQVEAAAMRLHGLDDEALRDAPGAAEAIPRFANWLGPAEDVRLLAHKARVEAGFLGMALEREGLDGTGLIVLDTLAASRWWMPEARSHRLGDLTAGLGPHDDGRPHRALADARRVAWLWGELRRRGLNPAAADRRELPAYRVGSPGLPEGWEWLILAIERGSAIRIIYEGGTKGLCIREVTPEAVIERGGREYMVGSCHLDHRRKSFRLDRIRETVGPLNMEAGLVSAGERR